MTLIVRDPLLKVDVEFETVIAYERSIYWAQTRERYRASDLPQVCRACGAKRVQLHHLHYRNPGNEDLADLMPLCQTHHYEVEKYVSQSKPLSREDATLDYLGSYEGRAEGLRIRSPRRLDPLAVLVGPARELTA